MLIEKISHPQFLIFQKFLRVWAKYASSKDSGG